MMPARRSSLRPALLLLSLACASAPAGPRPAGRDHSVIAIDELRTQHYMNAYAAVESLRGNWLRPRAIDSVENPTEVLVYVDGEKLGGVDALKAIDVNNVASIRRLDGNEATARWGVGHGSGVILVTTARAEPPTP